MRPGPAALLLAGSLVACGGSGGGGEDGPKDLVPPAIEITSPARGTLLEGATSVTVTGRATDDVEIAGVTINGRAASLEPDGTFSLTLEVAEGITLIESIASDAAGNQAADARGVLAGTLVDQATPVASGVAGHLAPPAMAGLAEMVSGLAAGVDWTALAASQNPVASGSTACGYDVHVTSVEHGGIDVGADAAAGGIAATVTVRDLVVDGHANWDACVTSGTTDFTITADAYDLTGLIAPRLEGSAIQVSLTGVTSGFRGFGVDINGVPGFVEDIIDGAVRDKLAEILRDKITEIVPPMATDFLAEFLADTWEVDLLGRTVGLSIAPVEMSWTEQGGTIVLDASAAVSGAEGGVYLSTPRPRPDDAAMASTGLRVAVADDLLNQLMAGIWVSGALEAAAVPVDPATLGAAIGADVDSATVTLMLPPVASFDTSTGTARLTVGDLVITAFAPSGDTVASFVISAEIDLAAETASTGQVTLSTHPARILGQVLEQSPDLLTPLDAQKVAAIGDLAIKQLSLVTDSLLDTLPIPGLPGAAITSPTLQPAGGYLLLGGEVEFQ
ncbi:MAG TPA: Ig-like domain-containing protein [Kofleriaceae bacterium]|nr:Ig-like domain-containing protein [Kofleriaceae bacterium]